MALKIIRATEPIEVKRLITTLYSQPGLGKTTLACTAEKPLLFDFDAGSHRAKNRPETVRVERWEDVVNMEASDFAGFKTAIIDTAGRALDILTPTIVKMDPKFGRKSGALTIQGFGELKSTFLTWLNTLKGFGLDVILVCHMEEQKKGDDVIERLDVQGGSKQELFKSADQMGRIYMENGQRIIKFDPSEAAFGKNPGELPPLPVPDYRTTPDFFAQVTTRVKAKLNELTAAQAAAAAFQADWKAKFDAAATPEDFTALMDPVRALDAATAVVIRPMMIQTAKAKGFTVSADKTKFEPIPAPAAAAPKDEAKGSSGTSPAPTAGESTSSSSPPAANAAGTAPTDSEKPQGDDKGDAPTAAELAAGLPQRDLPLDSDGQKSAAARGRRGGKAA